MVGLSSGVSAESIVVDSNSIKNATSGTGESEVGVFAVALPYYFDTDFDSNLSSSTMTNGSNPTVSITASNKGTYRFTPCSWHHADWTGASYFALNGVLNGRGW